MVIFSGDAFSALQNCINDVFFGGGTSLRDKTFLSSCTIGWNGNKGSSQISKSGFCEKGQNVWWMP